MSTLRGQVAVVTGASGGIGGAIAGELASLGAELLLSGRDAERLAAVAEQARRRGVRAEALAGDLADDQELEALARRALDAFGGVDLLVHSIGAFLGGNLEDSPVEELDLLYRVNVRIPYALTRLLLESLKERQGQIVFVNSSAGAATGRAGFGGYAASKHALRALADSLRAEVNPHGVRVLTAFPGRTASAMQEEVHRFEGLTYDAARWLQPEDVASSVVHALALPRSAELTDLHLRPMLG